MLARLLLDITETYLTLFSSLDVKTVSTKLGVEGMCDNLHHHKSNFDISCYFLGLTKMASLSAIAKVEGSTGTPNSVHT